MGQKPYKKPCLVSIKPGTKYDEVLTHQNLMLILVGRKPNKHYNHKTIFITGKTLSSNPASAGFQDTPSRGLFFDQGRQNPSPNIFTVY